MPTRDDHSDSMPPVEGAPPILGSWRRLYALVLGELVILILLMFLFRKAFE